jgi:putative tryptophan/tyrosine transport system substrate-binding protein
MRRREFITLLGATALAWPLGAQAQQPAMPVVGYLSSRSAETDASVLVAFRQGLRESGYVEGQNVKIVDLYADGQYDRLSALTSDLVQQRVAVIAHAGGGATTPNAVWQDMRTSKIPVVFNIPIDPVGLGLVASMNHPGGTMTGISSLATPLTAKRLGLLRELRPDAKTIALLIDKSLLGGSVLPEIRDAAATLGLQLRIISASTEGEIDAGIETLDQQPVEGMLVLTSPFFLTRAKQIAALATRHRVPAIYIKRGFVEAGGLMSYGYDMANGYRLMGTYVGRILKGESPSDLPVLQPTKFELVINRKSAKALGFTVPSALLALADEVIE